MRGPDEEPVYNVGLDERELYELIRLIDDEPVDEELLSGIRRKLAHKRKMLRQRKRKLSPPSDSRVPQEGDSENR